VTAGGKKKEKRKGGTKKNTPGPQKRRQIVPLEEGVKEKNDARDA